MGEKQESNFTKLTVTVLGTVISTIIIALILNLVQIDRDGIPHNSKTESSSADSIEKNIQLIENNPTIKKNKRLKEKQEVILMEETSSQPSNKSQKVAKIRITNFIENKGSYYFFENESGQNIEITSSQFDLKIPYDQEIVSISINDSNGNSVGSLNAICCDNPLLIKLNK